MRDSARKYTNTTVMLEPSQIDWLDSMASNNRFGITNRSAVLRYIIDHVRDIVMDINMDAQMKEAE